MSGWFANESIGRSFRSEAARLAPNVQVRFINGTDPQWRESVWHAADVFVSLADSVQETFGLTVVEAMSRGLPVIASDWNGYRESVVDGDTGILIPTAMFRSIGNDAMIAMLEGRSSYDQFLARIGQGVWVDPDATKNAIIELLDNPQRRMTMGKAGIERVQQKFTWQTVIGQFEDLWEEQHFQMQRARPLPSSRRLIPKSTDTDIETGADVETDSERNPAREDLELSICKPLDELFAEYPTYWLDEQTPLRRGNWLMGNALAVSQSPLSGHSQSSRYGIAELELLLEPLSDTASSQGMLALVTQTVHKLSAHRDQPVGVDDTIRRGLETLAWAMKFDLVAPAIEFAGLGKAKPATNTASNVENDSRDMAVVRNDTFLTFATTCMGRLEHLKQTLPKMVDQLGSHVVVVDYSCPDGAGDWVREHFDASQVSVVTMEGRTRFDRSEAKNAGIVASATPWVCLIDADILLTPNFAEQIRPLLRTGHSLRSSSILEGTGGTFIAQRSTLVKVGMHDPTYLGWGEEDDDLLDALHFAGVVADMYPDKWVDHIDHDDDQRTQFHDHSDRRISHMVNRVYRAAKWDMARMMNAVPRMPARQALYENITKQLTLALAEKSEAEIVIQTGRMNWVPLAAACGRDLVYRVHFDDHLPVGQYAIKK